MTKLEKNFCFCTLALGKKYRTLAALLASDIEKYSPNTTFVVLTDNPEEFSNFPHVLARKHQQQGVKCYHDKRFAIATALSLYNSCIFMDSDMRILAPVPEDMQWLQAPGITARACVELPKKYANVISAPADKSFQKVFELVKKAAQTLSIDAEWDNIKFVHEYLFSVTKDAGKEMEFLQQWDKLASYFELNGVFDAEGNAIGLAAAKAGLSVRWGEMPGISFFNNKIEAIRIQKGQSNKEEMSKYFEEHRKIIYPQRSLPEKVFSKLRQTIMHYYRIMRLRIAL